jgi:hypothetical protein
MAYVVRRKAIINLEVNEMDWLINGFAAIRKCDDDGHEWIETDTISYSRDETLRRVDDTNKKCGPQWANANRVTRIAMVKISE